MNRLLSALLIIPLGLIFCGPLFGQDDSIAGVDLLYPEFAHPREDAQEAIKQGDRRFIAIDRFGQVVPGVERYPRLRQAQGTKFLRQRFRIFATQSQNFSYVLRARAYAEQYNRTLLEYLLRRSRSD